ncbi:MAG: hypothetical protein E4G98_00685 [Promethearchaeota archaeon]|nr:MAG: hypothetical protein E4G98_00685 [Candidatus Lokiarchaeota archaeon]
MNSPKQRKSRLKVLQQLHRRNSKAIISLLVLFGFAGLASGVEILTSSNNRMDQGTFQTETISFATMEKVTSVPLKGEDPNRFEIIGLFQPISAQTTQDLYGFELILPGNRTSFQTLPTPTLTIIITDEELVLQSTYWFKISNRSEGTGYSNENSSDQIPFSPLESVSVTELNAIFAEFWGQTAEGVPIVVEFFINLEISSYETLIYKDVSPPEVQVGYTLTVDNAIVPVGEETYLFNAPPTLYYNITDNVPNNISVTFIVNNQQLTYSISVQNPKINPVNGNFLYNGVENISILDGEGIWENILEGEVTLIYAVHDAAGNPIVWKILSFVKDTVSPRLESGIPGLSWLKINEYEVDPTNSAIQNTFEVADRPKMQVTLQDSDIKIVKLKILNVHLLNASDTSSFIVSPPNAGLEPQSSKNEEYIYIQGIQNGSSWNIEIAPEIWDSLEDGLINMELELEDFAGNLAIFDFTVVKLGSPRSIIPIIYLFFGASAAIMVSLIIFSALLAVERQHLHTQIARTDYTSWNSIDPDLLDLVLEPLDHMKLARMTSLFTREGKNFDPHTITEPDLQKFLMEPLQLVHLRELRLLLTRYHMNSLDLEEFVHEMFALTPQERREFILRYMEAGNRNRSKFKGLGRDSALFLSTPQNSLPKAIKTDLWGVPEMDTGHHEEELLGEEEDPWENFESVSKKGGNFLTKGDKRKNLKDISRKSPSSEDSQS